MLIDFDGSGEIGTVAYPMNIDRLVLWLREGDCVMELIMADYDLRMLDTIHVSLRLHPVTGVTLF
jgi:hypothetical protein